MGGTVFHPLCASREPEICKDPTFVKAQRGGGVVEVLLDVTGGLANLVEDEGEGTVALVLLAELLVDGVVEHLVELVAGHAGEGIEGLETLDVTNVLLDGAKSGLGIVALLKDVVGDTIGTDVDEHVIVVTSDGVDETLDGGLGDAAGAEPEGVKFPLLVEDGEARVNVAEGDKHILVDVLLLVNLVEGLGGGELEERDLRGDEPTEGVAEEGVVSEGQNLSHLPEDGLGVTMVVVAEGQELGDDLLSGQEITNVLKEPRLPEAANRVVSTNLSINLVDHSTSHDDGGIAGVDEALNKIEASLAGTLVQEGDEVLAGIRRLVLDLNEGLGGDHHELGGNQETNGSIGPGHGVEELGVLSLAALNQLSRGQHNVVGDADVLEETVLP